MAYSHIRYLLAIVPFISVLCSFWLEYAGKFKYPIFSFILASSIFVIGSPFIAPSYAQNVWGTGKKIVYFTPVQPLYPWDDEDLRLYSIVDDIEREYKTSIRGKYDSFQIFFVPAQDDKEAKDIPIQMYEHYPDHVKTILLYRGFPYFPEQKSETNSDEFLSANHFVPIFLMVGFSKSNRGYPDEIIGRIKEDYGMKARKISFYQVKCNDLRFISLYLLTP